MKIKIFFIFLLLFTEVIYATPKLSASWVKNIQRKYTFIRDKEVFVKCDKAGNSYIQVEYDSLKFDNVVQNAKTKQASFVIIKFNTEGKLVWNFTLQDCARQISLNNWLLCDDGSTYISGIYYGALKINNISYDSTHFGFLIRLNKNGKISWVKTGREYLGLSTYQTKNNGIGLFGFNYISKKNASIFADTSQIPGSYEGICELDSNGKLYRRNTFKLSAFNNPNFTVNGNSKGNTYAILLLEKDTFISGKNVLVHQKGSRSSFYFMYLDKNLNPKWIKEWPNSTINAYQREFTNSDFRVDDNGGLVMAAEFKDTIKMDGKTLLVDTNLVAYSSCIAKFDTTSKLNWIRQSGTINGGDLFYPFDLINNKLYCFFFNSGGLMSMDTFLNRPSPANLIMKPNGKVDDIDTLFQRYKSLMLPTTNGKEWYNVEPFYETLSIGGKNYTPRKNVYSDVLLVKYDSAGSVGIEEEKNTHPIECKIYPNPGKELINIRFKSTFKGDISIFNSLGQLVFQRNNLNDHLIQFNLNGLPNGIFHIMISSHDGLKGHYKWIKE